MYLFPGSANDLFKILKVNIASNVSEENKMFLELSVQAASKGYTDLLLFKRWSVPCDVSGQTITLVKSFLGLRAVSKRHEHHT